MAADRALECIEFYNAIYQKREKNRPYISIKNFRKSLITAYFIIAIKKKNTVIIFGDALYKLNRNKIK